MRRQALIFAALGSLVFLNPAVAETNDDASGVKWSGWTYQHHESDPVGKPFTKDIDLYNHNGTHIGHTIEVCVEDVQTVGGYPDARQEVAESGDLSAGLKNHECTVFANVTRFFLTGYATFDVKYRTKLN